MNYTPQIYLGDCQKVLSQLPDASIDLIFTSPPYAQQRQKSYGGIPTEQYVQWFLPIAKELQRVLKPQGTFILNIKENVIKGQRSPYVLQLILALREQGWLWTEEFIWHKKNAFPGKWNNRFRDAWERLLQFNKQRQFHMYQDAVMVPAAQSTLQRMQSLSSKDYNIRYSSTGSGMGVKTSNWKGRQKVYPSNVIHLRTTNYNKGHSATFPDALAQWFIQLFTQQADTVLDPFMGSGTTNLVAQNLKRHSVGIEIKPAYFQLVQKAIAS